VRPAILSRSLHKWLALFLGLQVVVWAVSGFYMVVVDLDFIHGDPLVRNLRVPLPATAPPLTVAEVLRDHPQVTQIALRSLPGMSAPVYQLSTPRGSVLLDAVSGRQLSPLSPRTVRDLAKAYYAGDGQLASASLIESDPPTEVPASRLPLWRVDFDDWLETSLYLHPDTGMLVTRRHRFWRWFDFLWMLHIMDYEAREDVNNGVLRATTVLGTLAVGSGAWLLYFSFRRRRPATAAMKESS